MRGQLFVLGQEVATEADALPGWVVWATVVSFALGLGVVAVGWVRAKQADTTPQEPADSGSE